MIHILSNHALALEVDPNENGLPILIITIKYMGKIRWTIMLSAEQTEELTKELQRLRAEM